VAQGISLYPMPKKYYPRTPRATGNADLPDPKAGGSKSTKKKKRAWADSPPPQAPQLAATTTLALHLPGAPTVADPLLLLTFAAALAVCSVSAHPFGYHRGDGFGGGREGGGLIFVRHSVSCGFFKRAANERSSRRKAGGRRVAFRPAQRVLWVLQTRPTNGPPEAANSCAMG
jgi:hypothetical protein